MGVSVSFLYVEPWGDSYLRTISLFATILLRLLCRPHWPPELGYHKVCFGQQLLNPGTDMYTNFFQEGISDWELGRERTQKWCPLALLASGEDYNSSLDVC